ncbi:MAG: hypothetical protein KA802_10540 [Saprospiraceae bacterium]|nr:hypothetical protein [Saprospiraceae bacterium]
MAFPTGTETSTTLAELIPLKWGDRINDFFKLKLMIADFFTDRSAELADGGSALYTPNLTEMSANSKTVATAVTLNQPTETKVTLSVNQWYEVSFAIEDREAAQVKHSYYLQEKYAMNAGYTMAKKLEVALAALFAGFSTTVGASTTNLADSEIRSAIATLEAVGIDTTEDVAFFVSPNVFWKQIQNIDKFSLAINSPVNDPTAKTPKATLYGIPVYVSNNIQYVSGTTGRANALAHKDALHFATSPLGSGGSMGSSMTGKYGVRVQSHYIPEYLSTVTTADLLYGVVENRDNAGVCIYSAA